MCIAASQGQTTSRGHNFDVNSNFLPLQSFATSFKKNLFEVWFNTHFFMILYMYIALGQWLTTPWGQNFDVILSLQWFVASLKKNSLKSDLIHIFHDFIHVYSPWAGADNPLGTKFWCNLVISIICWKFQKNLFQVWFYTSFFMI